MSSSMSRRCNTVSSLFILLFRPSRSELSILACSLQSLIVCAIPIAIKQTDRVRIQTLSSLWETSYIVSSTCAIHMDARPTTPYQNAVLVEVLSSPGLFARFLRARLVSYVHIRHVICHDNPLLLRILSYILSYFCLFVNISLLTKWVNRSKIILLRKCF